MRTDYRGQTFRVKDTVKDYSSQQISGKDITILGYWDELTGTGWGESHGNMAACMFAFRMGLAGYPPPSNDQVLYGKIGSLSYLVCIDELET